MNWDIVDWKKSLSDFDEVEKRGRIRQRRKSKIKGSCFYCHESFLLLRSNMV